MPKKVFYQTSDHIQICALLNESDETPQGTVVLAHGISSEKTEDGIFNQLAKALCSAHFNTLQFDFRGHGESEGKQEEMTVSGELEDLKASIKYARQYWSLPTAIVAASFGAVATLLYSSDNKDIPCIVLWNPVLDLKKTFLEPTLPWAKQSFNPQGFDFLEKNGYLLLDQFFRLGQPLIDEMFRVSLLQHAQKITCPVLTLHGDKDTYVPYDVAKQNYRFNSQCKFITVPDSEHGFGRLQDKELVIPSTVSWIQKYIG